MIVNADDLGFTEDRNRAVLRAFDEGLISSATIMATTSAFEGACEEVRAAGLDRHVGAHLVLTEGTPLTDDARLVDALCDGDGRFRTDLDLARIIRLNRVARDALAAEARAQIARARAQGLSLTHIDSHHHVHAEPVLIEIVIGLARQFGIPWIRLARNCDPRTGLPRRLVNAYVNRRLRRAGLARTRWFGRPEDYEALGTRNAPARDDIEVMVHPAFSPIGELVDMSGISLSAFVRRLEGHEQAVSYAGEPLPGARRATEA